MRYEGLTQTGSAADREGRGRGFACLVWPIVIYQEREGGG